MVEDQANRRWRDHRNEKSRRRKALLEEFILPVVSSSHIAEEINMTILVFQSRRWYLRAN
jgi:hypothetical protein